jgi:hypothetical protein
VTAPEVSQEVHRLDVLEARERGNWWPVAVSVGSSILSAALAVTLCLNVSFRNAERGRDQRKIIQATAEQQRQALCALIISLDDNAALDRPVTELGKSNAKTYASLRVSQGCPPREGN